LQHVRATLESASEHELKQFGTGKPAKLVQQFLRCADKELKALRVKGKGWKAIQPGVKAAFTQARRAYQIACEDSMPENLHAWRKCAKTLWYHTRLLQRLWPEQMEAMARELETLSEHLGDHHDLVMLREAVENREVGKVKPSELETLNGLAEERQRELRAAALALGARFFAEKPAAFCDRLAGYWRTWGGKKSSSAFLSQQSIP
jgi:CHAD domain-containing protein